MTAVVIASIVAAAADAVAAATKHRLCQAMLAITDLKLL